MMNLLRMSIAIIALVVPVGAVAQSIDEEMLIRATFAELNAISIAQNIEYCGYVGYTAEGELAISPAVPGTSDSCLADDPVNLEIIVASYHTHAAFSPDYSSEVPSGSDMEGDEAEGIDGWVATPGGRIWFIDTTDMISRQICGIGCTTSDPNFIAGDDGIIEQSYSYDELIIKLDG